MRGFLLRCAIGVGATFGLAGCIPTPGPGDYASASSYHEQRAAEHATAAQRAQQTAGWRAAYGDYAGVSAAQARAAQQSGAAQRQQFQANKDNFLSGF